MNVPYLIALLRADVRQVQRTETAIAGLSIAEQIGVALILNRLDLLPEHFTHVLQAVDRLGPAWTEAALAVVRTGWAQS